MYSLLLIRFTEDTDAGWCSVSKFKEEKALCFISGFRSETPFGAYHVPHSLNNIIIMIHLGCCFILLSACGYNHRILGPFGSNIPYFKSISINCYSVFSYCEQSTIGKLATITFSSQQIETKEDLRESNKKSLIGNQSTILLNSKL